MRQASAPNRGIRVTPAGEHRKTEFLSGGQIRVVALPIVGRAGARIGATGMLQLIWCLHSFN
jgi:hypothetical protein